MATNLHSKFVINAQKYRNSPALSLDGQQWTYGELDATARRLAYLLSAACTTRLDRVGVFSCGGKNAYFGLLAALYCGAAFVPLNATLPAKRIRQVLIGASLSAVIVDPDEIENWAEVVSGSQEVATLVPHDDTHNDIPSEYPHANSVYEADALNFKPREAPEESIAYLLFTSGSTGSPKAVPISHKSVCNFLSHCTDRYRLGPGDVVSQTYELSFDAAVFCIFIAWWSGACVSGIPKIELLSPFDFIERERITWWNSVPSVASLLSRQGELLPDSMPGLKWSIFGGETLSSDIAMKWQAAAPNSTLENLYGPTEATIACTAYRWDALRSPPACLLGSVPIGEALGETRILVVDESLDEVSPGQIGELCVAGPQVFGGYLNDASQTAARMFTRSAPGEGALHFFRTGDRVRLIDGRNLSYLGRLDHQVQIRGHRVELGEIEHALMSQEGIEQVVALGWPMINGQTLGIIAFAVGVGRSSKDVISGLRLRLPAHMLPQQIIPVKSLPRNKNGKLDRMKLYEMLQNMTSPNTANDCN